jgi:very-short-patch-repair endonuclease
LAANVALAGFLGPSVTLPATTAANVVLGRREVPSATLTAMADSCDRAVARAAARQRTVISAAQLVACGLGPDAITYRVHTGRLTERFRGVYSVVCGELPPLAREHAALLACGDGAFLSHRSAAFVWGMRKAPPAIVEVSVPGRHRRSRDGLVVHRIQAIDRRDVRHHEGLWVSSPARAVLEVAAVAPGELVDVIDEGLARRLITRPELERVLARNRPCRGAARLAALLGDETAMTITRSRAEKAFLKLIRESGLPRPETNVRFGPYEPDFVWRRERLIVELDSPTFHGGPRAFQHDREKDLFYRDARFDVLRFTREHVVHEPPRVLVRLAQALARRHATD